jgi:hypothetical protein
MTTSQEMRLNQQKDYLAFREIKDETDALEFVKERLTGPVGKSYYTPTDYRWATMSLRARLVDAHARHWFSVWGLLHMKNKPEDDAKFGEQELLVISAMVREMDHLEDWVSSRYSIPSNSYLLPSQFAFFKEEAEEDWDVEDTLDIIKFGEHREHYKDHIRYYWKKVEPEQEDPADERRHVILMDMETQEEAPLLPGVEPYKM